MEMVLPKGWGSFNISLLTGYNGLFSDGDWVESKDQDPNGDVRLIQLADIGENEFKDKSNRFLNQEKADELKCTFLKKNDVLIARMPDPIGRSCIFPLSGKYATVVDIAIVRFDQKYFNPFLFSYFVNSPSIRKQMLNLASGSTRQRISRRNLDTILFPLPPLSEQERIVVKLEKLFAQHEKIKKALDHIPQLLKTFRQQVLTQAVTGKLTEQWREGKEMQIDYESIDEYLKNFKRFKPIDQNAEPSEIPNWHNVKMGNVSYVSNGSTPSRSVKEYWGGNIAWIGSGQIQNNKIKLAKEFITNKGLANSSIRILPKGTVLIAMIGEGKTRAQSSILEIQATINQNVASIEIGHSQIVPEYLQYFLIKNYELHRTIGNGTGPKALNCQRVKEFDFQLPPLQEQQEIVRRVESLFAKADAIETRYQTVKAKVDNLPQVILHKAFKGELVPQLPKDGDAKDLLAEIMALKAEPKGKKRK